MLHGLMLNIYIDAFFLYGYGYGLQLKVKLQIFHAIFRVDFPPFQAGFVLFKWKVL